MPVITPADSVPHEGKLPHYILQLVAPISKISSKGGDGQSAAQNPEDAFG
jgi:hypothetical protein